MGHIKKEGMGKFLQGLERIETPLSSCSLEYSAELSQHAK